MTNKSVTKAVPLLRELAAQPRPGATVTTLAKAVGISRPTAFRLLYSLERTRLVDRIDNNYLLGWELTRPPGRSLCRTGRPSAALLQELADKFNESASMSVPNAHDGVDLMAETFGSHLMATYIPPMRFPRQALAPVRSRRPLDSSIGFSPSFGVLDVVDLAVGMWVVIGAFAVTRSGLLGAYPGVGL